MSPQLRPLYVAVHHLVGPQGSGKSVHAASVIMARRLRNEPRAVELDRFDFETHYAGRIDLVVEDMGPLDLVMISHQQLPFGATPPHWMRGDEVIWFPLVAAPQPPACMRPASTGGAR